MPQITLKNLKPHNAYQLRVFVWDDRETQKLGMSSETLTVFTDDGCVRNDITYSVGQTFNEGCDLTCICKGDDTDQCNDRCVLPYHKKGSKKLDSFCFETPSSEDACCVTIRCTSDTEESKENNMCIYKNTTYNRNEMFLDGCEFRCVCDNNLNVQCHDRCPSKLHQMMATDPECHVTDDIHDPCCKVITCDPIVHVPTMSSVHEERIPANNMSEKSMWSDNTTMELPLPGMTRPQDVDMLQKNLNKTDIYAMFDNGPSNGARFDGCEYKNKSYNIGDQFDNGCETRCLCDGPGHMSCVPRCPQANEAGGRCTEVQDPRDPCCKLVLCDPPGDKDSVANAEGLAVTIEEASPQNGTSVRLRISFNDGILDGSIQVWYSAAGQVTSWNKFKVTKSEMKALEGTSYEIDVLGLIPNTEYYFKLSKSGERTLFSNTIHAKTYSSAVKSVVKGCLYHNNTYEAGQIFEEGCELRCICQKSGKVECRERCETFIDTVGLERCRWGPAPDDSCCTIPYCDQEDTLQTGDFKPSGTDHPSLEEPYCIIGRNQGYRVGERWDSGEGCWKKSCSCMIHRNGSVFIECEDRCPPLPASVNQPTPECPQPVLVTPEDPCICPHVICNSLGHSYNVPNPICLYQGDSYHAGEEFYKGCQAVCHCGLDLKVNCVPLECPRPHQECIEWEEHPQFVPTPPNCCAPLKCKNDGSCNIEGISIKNYNQVPSELLDCGMRCVCVHGNITCENRCEHLPERPPPHLPCPPQLAYKGHLPGDSCCLHWMCKEPQSVTKELEDVSIVVINETTVRVRFSLPALLVGLNGHAELHYTTNPNLTRSLWQHQKFARPKRLFDTRNIEYFMGNLRADTNYFFQVHIYLETLVGGPKSDVFEVRLPPIPTTPMPSSTVPPIIRLNVSLAVQKADSNSLNISWRSFDPSEKQYLDGLRLQYRKLGDSGLITSPLIHRDMRSFLLRDLKPDTLYSINLIFMTPKGIATTVLSNSPLEAKTASLPKDDYDFKILLRNEKVGPYSSELLLSGIPTPVSKFIHIIRLTYKTDSDAEQTYVFKMFKAEKLALEQLKPGRRYKVWADLYLTNGKTLTSNVIEFMTKAASPSFKFVPEITTANPAEALHGDLSEAGQNSYYVALIIVAIVATVAGVGFFGLLAIVLKRQGSAKAPITRPASESAYDNPTYKTYDGEKEEKNGVQA